MTSEYHQEYSEQIKFAGWSDEWRLDKDDEDQLRVDVDEGRNFIKYLERRKRIGTQGRAPKVKE